MTPRFKLPPPLRPRILWGGYVGTAFILAMVAREAAWVPNFMALVLLFCIVETVRFYRCRRKQNEPSMEVESSPVGRVVEEAEGPNAYQEDDDDFLADGRTIWQGSRRIRFAYGNYQGESTDREVTVHKVVAVGRTNGDTYFQGHCHLRNEPRTFRVDRIKGRKVVDTSTGEIATFRQLFGLR